MQEMCGVRTIVGNVCIFGMRSMDEIGEAPVYKPTKFMTNSSYAALELNQLCDRMHRHVRLLHGRAKNAEIFPQGLCEAICRAVKKQKESDKTGVFFIGSVGIGVGNTEREKVMKEALESTAKCHGNEEWDKWKQDTEAYDDVTGERLDISKVLKAREEENEIFPEDGGVP